MVEGSLQQAGNYKLHMRTGSTIYDKQSFNSF